MLASKYLILIAALSCCLSRVLAVTCEDDPTDDNCIDCSTDTTDSEECTTTTTTTTTTVAPTSTSTTVAPAAAAGNQKIVKLMNLKYNIVRMLKAKLLG